MNNRKKEKLQKHGWAFGDTKDFLGLSEEEELYVNLKLTLSKNLKKMRKNKHLSQTQLAKILKSSQSRVAKMEKSDPSVSIDLLIKSLGKLGVTQRTLSRMLFH